MYTYTSLCTTINHRNALISPTYLNLTYLW